MRTRVLKPIDMDEVSVQELNLIEEIVKLRQKKKMSQSNVEELTGISQSNIARFEKDTHSASLSTVLKVLNALGYRLAIRKK